MSGIGTRPGSFRHPQKWRSIPADECFTVGTPGLLATLNVVKLIWVTFRPHRTLALIRMTVFRQSDVNSPVQQGAWKTAHKVLVPSWHGRSAGSQSAPEYSNKIMHAFRVMPVTLRVELLRRGADR